MEESVTNHFKTSLKIMENLWKNHGKPERLHGSCQTKSIKILNIRLHFETYLTVQNAS